MIASGLLDQRELYKISVNCPHCLQEIDYLFPLDIDFKTREGFVRSLAPVPSFCGKCHRRLIVPLLDLSGMKQEYDAYVESVNAIAASGKPVIISPVLSQDEMDVHKFYGLNWDALNIAFFLDMRVWWPTGVSFLSYPVLTLQDKHNILRYKDFHFVILPCAEFEDILCQFTENGIPMDRISYLDIKLPKRKIKQAHSLLAALVMKAKSSRYVRYLWQNLSWLRKLIRPILDKVHAEMR